MATRKRRAPAKRPAAKRQSGIPTRVKRPRLRTRARAWLTAHIVHRALRNPLVKRAVERLQRRDEAEYAAMHPAAPSAQTAPATPETKQPDPQVIVVQVPAGTDPQSVQVLHPAQQTRQTRPTRRQRQRPAAQPYPPLRAVSTPSPQSRPRVLPQQRQPTPMVGSAPVAQPGSAPAAPEQLARMITGMLAQKGGSAVEVSSLASMFAARGVGAQAVRAALWHAHANGWVKKSGKGKVAATAKTVRAGGVPPDRKAGKTRRKKAG